MAGSHRRPIADQFAIFAEAIGDEVPLYTRLCEAIVEEPELLALADQAIPGQPAANMLFGSVQYLLLGGVAHPLGAWYPAVSGRQAPGDDPAPVFLDFCRRHRDELADLIATRRTQTNEVARCLALLPALATLSVQVDGPLALAELGSSAGLLLAFDRYRYVYGTRTWGPADSPVQLTTELRGAQPPVPHELAIERRLGIDLHPVDITSEHDRRWLDAMVWPGHEHRRRRLRAAIALAAPDPPRLISGDALELLPGLIESIAPEIVPIVFHSFALIQWGSDQRARLAEILRDAGRPVYRIWLEWFGFHRSWPLIRLFEYRDGSETVATLGRFHHHCAWLDWGWTEPPASGS
jgi:hypothetical protein